MPHITVEMLLGRTEEKKQKLAHVLSVAAAGVVDVDPSDVSISICEIDAADWKKRVYDRVLADQKTLYKVPKPM